MEMSESETKNGGNNVLSMVDELKDVIKDKLLRGCFTVIEFRHEFESPCYYLDIDGLRMRVVMGCDIILNYEPMIHPLFPTLSYEENTTVCQFILKGGIKNEIDMLEKKIKCDTVRLDGLRQLYNPGVITIK